LALSKVTVPSLAMARPAAPALPRLLAATASLTARKTWDCSDRAIPSLSRTPAFFVVGS
jgi:hypothetical protein